MTFHQFIRYGVIGLAINVTGYASYLVLTHTLLGSRSAMTLTYCSGVLIGFALNRKITFQFAGDRSAAFTRYVAAYALGYGINLAGLWLFVDCFGVAREIVQGDLILCLTVALFLLQRLWVFPIRGSRVFDQMARPVP
jgi:putative flippase GtrA